LTNHDWAVSNESRACADIWTNQHRPRNGCYQSHRREKERPTEELWVREWTEAGSAIFLVRYPLFRTIIAISPHTWHQKVISRFQYRSNNLYGSFDEMNAHDTKTESSCDSVPHFPRRGGGRSDSCFSVNQNLIQSHTPGTLRSVPLHF